MEGIGGTGEGAASSKGAAGDGEAAHGVVIRAEIEDATSDRDSGCIGKAVCGAECEVAGIHIYGGGTEAAGEGGGSGSDRGSAVTEVGVDRAALEGVCGTGEGAGATQNTTRYGEAGDGVVVCPHGECAAIDHDHHSLRWN